MVVEKIDIRIGQIREREKKRIIIKKKKKYLYELFSNCTWFKLVLYQLKISTKEKLTILIVGGFFNIFFYKIKSINATFES